MTSNSVSPRRTLNQQVLARRGAERRFGLFPCFPTELRHMIWTAFLAENRILDINIRGIRSRKPRFGEKNHLGNLTSGTVYTVRRSHLRTIRSNPIFQVSREARTVALGFYRVQLPFLRKFVSRIWDRPYQLDSDSDEEAGVANRGERKRTISNKQHNQLDEEERGVLFFNPEYDILHLRPEGYGDDLISVMHDLKAYDPKGRGVLNLMIGDDREQGVVRLPLHE